MPKYTNDMIAGYYLYFTSKCIVEAFHVHASDKKLTESGSAKFWVGSDGITIVQNKGKLSDKSIHQIQKYIKSNYLVMYEKWRAMSENGFYDNVKSSSLRNMDAF